MNESYFVFFSADVSQTYGFRSQKKLAENIDWSYTGNFHSVVMTKTEDIYDEAASNVEE